MTGRLTPTRVQKLNPEDLRALEHLDSSLQSIQPSMEVSSAIWNHDAISLFTQPLSIKKIPSTIHWRWNQTKGKKMAYLDKHKAEIVFVKLIPRKIRPNSTANVPSYKLWQFNVAFTDGRSPVMVFWCEKGKKEEQADLDDLFNAAVTQEQNKSETPEAPNRLYAARLSYILN